LLNGCWIRSVGDIQLSGNELVRQNYKPVPLGGTIQDLNQLQFIVADGAERQILHGPNIGMVFPIALRIRAILSRIAR